MLCNYGCGQEAKYQLKNKKWCCNKNIASCPFIRKKISNSNKNKVKSKKWKKNISDKSKGRIPWNKNKNDYLTDEIREKMGIKNKGKIPWNKGKKNPYEKQTIEKMIEKAKVRTGNISSNWKGGYYSKNIPIYDKYIRELHNIEQCRRNKDDNKVLDIKCAYCGKWFTPTISQIYERIRSIFGKQVGEQRLYCSEQCKKECPIYRQKKYPKDFKVSTSREVQADLRQLRFEKDNYTCQKCFKHKDELEVALHCHHLEGIKWEPFESADVDKVLTVCKTCHLEIHKKEDCKYNDLRCTNEKSPKNR